MFGFIAERKLLKKMQPWVDANSVKGETPLKRAEGTTQNFSGRCPHCNKFTSTRTSVCYCSQCEKPIVWPTRFQTDKLYASCVKDSYKRLNP